MRIKQNFESFAMIAIKTKKIQKKNPNNLLRYKCYKLHVLLYKISIKQNE